MSAAIADFDYNDFSQDQQEADKNLLVKFFTKPRLNEAESEKEGRPIYNDRVYVEIRFPGNRTDVICRPAKESDLRRFSRHYAAWKERKSMDVLGTPLNEWPVVTRSQVEELSFFNVKTVEQLAGCADSNAVNIRGFHGLKEKAKKFLEISKAAVDVGQLKDELTKRDDQIEKLESRIDELLSTVEALSREPPPPPKKTSARRKKQEVTDKADELLAEQRGRPPKDE